MNRLRNLSFPLLALATAKADKRKRATRNASTALAVHGAELLRLLEELYIQFQKTMLERFVQLGI